MLVATYKTKKVLKESVGKSIGHMETCWHGAWGWDLEDGELTMIGLRPSDATVNWTAHVTMKDGLIFKVK